MTDEIQNIKVNLKFLVIPFEVYEDNRLNATQIKIYAFINSFRGDKFFFSNAHMAEMFKVSENTISTAVNKLQEFGYIKATYKIKADGGKIRFIVNILNNDDLPITDTKTSCSRKPRHLGDNDNKINVNNLHNNNLPISSKSAVNIKKSNKDYKKQEYKDEDKTYSLLEYADNRKDLSESLRDTIHYYDEMYEEKTGSTHPRLKLKQWWEVEEALSSFEACYELDSDGWVAIVDQWFKKKEGTDFNIIHFTTGDIMDNCTKNAGLF